MTWTVEDVGYLVNKAMMGSRDLGHLTAPSPADWDKVAAAATEVLEASEALLWIATLESNIEWSKREDNRAADLDS
jgi:hypothetical protein